MKPPSNVSILVDEVDVTTRCLWERSKFRTVANAIPGSFELALKDVDHTYDPPAGSRVQLLVDGQVMFGGYVKIRGQGHWFPVHDTNPDPLTMPRLWLLKGPCANVLFDRRVVHDTGNRLGPNGENDNVMPNEPNYLKRLGLPGGRITQMVKYFWRRYTDFVYWQPFNPEVPESGEYIFEVYDTNVNPINLDYPEGLAVSQGKYVRDQMEDFAQYGGVIYYIDGEWALNFESYRAGTMPWGFTDYRPFGPNDQWVGFREMDYDEDALQMVTDALVWGGSALHKPGTDPEGDTPVGTVFARYPKDVPKTYKIPGTTAWKTRLDESIGANTTEFRVRSVADMPPVNTGPYGNLSIRIDDEEMFVVGVSGRTLTVVRGTVKDSHNDGARVIHDAEAPVVLSRTKEEQALARLEQYGRWQRAEMRPGQDMYLTEESVKLRAYTIVSGTPGIDPVTGIDGGLNVPQPTITLTWFAHDVPSANHLKAGYIVDFQLYTLGNDIEHPLILTLPCRSLSIDFVNLPTDNPDHDPLAHVRFTGEFGMGSTDSRKLWQYLRNRRPKVIEGAGGTIKATVDNSTAADNGVSGARGTFFPVEDLDGSRVTFTLPVSYRAGTTQVYLNGLLQNVNVQYRELDPGAGQIRFVVAPYSDDDVRVVCIVGGAS